MENVSLKYIKKNYFGVSDLFGDIFIPRCVSDIFNLSFPIRTENELKSVLTLWKGEPDQIKQVNFVQQNTKQNQAILATENSVWNSIKLLI